MTSTSFLGRFRDMVEVETDAGCHVWTGRKDRDGYGIFREDGSDVRAHVRSWETANGQEVPAGLVVAHTCDRPGCVNPAHLDAKTQAENVEDRQRRGRQARGSQNGRAKLDEAQVSALKRALKDGGIPDARLARIAGVSRSVLRDIKGGKTWGHVEPE